MIKEKKSERQEALIKKMEPKIKKSVQSIPWQYREDVEQEIKMKVMESIDNVKTVDVPGFFEYTQKEKRRKAGKQRDKSNVSRSTNREKG
ncbi:hypothetical protein [Alkalicoccobacillus porphyridii]|uniref:Uncharacterized protein n=1 Tax=Alkalicoccobacillus porphyridii TaxID=2597270 RepID=A0A554A2G0_9BACI|nr:hypothetical protein [Alkalicoccobacillus porphyridii]TSB47879.1 hypothetical protein FN960_05065 [Alkalicoccobacillus porphyridii]